MPKVKIQIKSRWFVDKVLFEYESDDNTIKKTLVEAVEEGADLRGAYLRGADLQGAYLQGADLQGADLQGADLQDAYLRGAYLQGAYLQGADLRGAYLRGADLQGAYLQGAYLQGADLQGAENAEYAIALTVVPSDGTIIGWKKCRDNRIVKLHIPTKAKRSNATGRKCRAESAKVLAIYEAGSAKPLAKTELAYSQHDNKFTYKVGETVKPSAKFDLDRWNECAPGIHFFITREEAERYC